ncbi:cytochrome c oxidase subunit VA-domain-containing protein [Morchella snyderi]|nr:cytochrome c oxidase subunit VA-domain-containing protein [Morchella snyderi]
MASFLRIASSAARPILRTSTTQVPRVVVPTVASKASAIRFYSDSHEESFEEFTARYEKEFENVNDVFELQRNLNNAFAYDLVPSPSVIVAALKAARRVNDFPTAVRIFEGIKAKVENKQQYHQYLDELKGLREELGVSLVEDLYPENK